MPQLKTSYVCSVVCPHCSNNIAVIKETEIIRPSEPGEKKVVFKAEKEGIQKTLAP